MQPAHAIRDLLRFGPWRRSNRSPEQDIASLLAAFRFLALAVVVTLTSVVGSRVSLQTELVVLATLATVSSLIVVALGLRLTLLQRVGPAILVTDLAIGVTGIAAGGGMDSPFLLYALLPVLTASLLMHQGLAVLLGLVPGLTVVLAHTVFSGYFDRVGWIILSNYLTLVPVYFVVGLAVAVLPFFANLNLRATDRERARRGEQRMLRAELHDKLAQSLSALTMGLRQLDRVSGSEEVGELTHVSERSYAELRELLDLLEAGSWQPTAVDTLGRLVDDWSHETGIRVTADLPPGELALPAEVALALLGIAREALTNVGRHSGARRVWVSVAQEGEETVLEVRDDGRGFSDQRPAGHGRRIMQERADSVGADLVIDSKPGNGTKVRVRYSRQDGARSPV